jgi:Uma2 family endonuclease
MAVIDAPLPTSARSHGSHIYVRPPRPIHFPSSCDLEEVVPENRRHLMTRTTLFVLLDDAYAAQAAVGSDQFVYWDPEDPRKCVAPDVFVKLGGPVDDFDSWKVWERGAPDLAVEIVSASDRAAEDWTEKLMRYSKIGLREMVRFDADSEAQPIRVWDRIDGDFVERAAHDQDLRECATLGLWWTIVPTKLGPMLRLSRDRAGADILLTPSEERTRLSEERLRLSEERLRLAEELAEERRARSQAEHERLLIEHERLLAEQKLREEAQERARAEHERLLAEQKLREEAQERSRAEHERDAALAENEQLRAELARLRGK